MIFLKLGLGIDTGGTYTDAVIYDFENSKILECAKSLTVKENLTSGINNVLCKLSADKLKNIELVSLSTTLATNACVEGKGCRALLVMIGCDEDIAAKYGRKYGLPDTREIIFLAGGHNQQGEVNVEPDWDFLQKKISAARNDTDAFAVVELWGIRNSSFERKAKNTIMELTGKPVVCAHELTAEINSLKRAASSLLNAQFIPLIDEFINAVKSCMKTMEIAAPLVIVRGDGSLMSEDFAREKPVETLLSGPSASVAGGMSITGSKDCIIVDMGGTTSDLAIVRNGMARLAEEGVNVGKWRTGTKSILINTVGLGGDSLIRYGENNEIKVGPVRAAPLSWLAFRWPQTLHEMKRLLLSKKKHSESLCEFLYLVRDISDDSYFSEDEKKAAQALKNGPLSILALSEATGISIYSKRLKRLEQLGIIMRSGLTPTDIMHLTGDYCEWSLEAASTGSEIMAFQLGIGIDDLINRVNTTVKQKLYFNIVKMLLENENGQILKNGLSEQFMDLIMMGYNDNEAPGKKENCQSGSYITCGFKTDLELVGLGAPVHIFLPDVANILNTRCIIPENASVANAIGAITGNVTAEETVILRPKYEVHGITGYICYSSEGRREFDGYDEALDWARAEAVRIARSRAISKGSGHMDIITEENNNEVRLSGFYEEDIDSPLKEEGTDGENTNKRNAGMLLLETTVTARAMGTLKWL